MLKCQLTYSLQSMFVSAVCLLTDPYNCLVMPLDVFLTLLINGPQLLLHICLTQNYQLTFQNGIDQPLQQSVQTATVYSEMLV